MLESQMGGAAIHDVRSSLAIQLQTEIGKGKSSLLHDETGPKYDTLTNHRYTKAKADSVKTNITLILDHPT